MTISKKPVLMLCIASIVFAFCVHFAVVKSRDWLLFRDAQTTGMDWAKHLEKRIPNLPEIIDNGPNNKKLVPKTKLFSDLVREVLSLGNIYQVDFINADCYCELSLGYYGDPTAGSNGGSRLARHKNFGTEGTIHNHGSAVLQSNPKQGLVAHVFTNRKSHPFMRKKKSAGNQLPLDRQLLQSIIGKMNGHILLRETAGVEQPETFAEAYHTINVDGKTVYVVRVLVDLAARAERYTFLLYTGATVIVVMLLLAFWFPASQLVKSAKKQQRSDERAHYLALHDPLTGVSNRTAFQEYASNMLSDCNTDGCPGLLLFLIDVDKFKDINDYHGHHAGDNVLINLAKQLSSIVPEGSVVARLGGDEFAIIMCGADFQDRPAESILDLPNQFEFPVNDYDTILPVSICAGLARYPRDGSNVKELMQHADLALYKAKGSKEKRIVEYDQNLGASFNKRMALKEEFRAALLNKQIVPYYQPLISIQTGRVEGLEALARWMHTENGIVSPAGFQAALDDHELCSMLGLSMLDSVCQDMAVWKENDVDFQSVGLNVSEGDLMRPDFIERLVANLKTFDLKGNDLAIEVTENAIYGKNKSAGLERLHAFRSLGCYVALDDFGTGYSSITHLKELPCTAVKVDKSFVSKVVDSTIDQSIIRSLRGIGNTAGFKLVVEGVETAAQLELLRSLGCDLAQGYYYSRPVSAEDVPNLIEQLYRETVAFDDTSDSQLKLSA